MVRCFHHVAIYFSRNDVNPASIDILVGRNYLYNSNKHNICTHIVIGLFQWSFSFKVRDPITRERRPPLFSKWKQETTNVIQETIQNGEFLAACNATPQLFLRSAHSNPLKQDTGISSCPQIDWRTPINAGILCSKVLQKSVTKTKMSPFFFEYRFYSIDRCGMFHPISITTWESKVLEKRNMFCVR